jgi:CubicO group peptidase (beta-lactamase class C family)
MKKFFYFTIILLFAGCTASKQIFNNTITTGSHSLNLDTLAANLATALSQKSIKYGFVLQHALYQTSKVGGLKRTAADPPQTNFALTDRLNPASVTKVITATGVLKILGRKKYSLDTTIAAFLPSSWTIHPTIKKATFRLLLEHRAGFIDTQFSSDDYPGFKQYIQTGIDTSKIGQYNYSNYGYDLCRILIPYLNGYHDNASSNIDAETYNLFVKYMQDSIYTPLNIQNVQYAPASTNQALFYTYPPGTTNGTDFRNTSPGPGSAGVQLSINELSTFLFNLINTNLLLPEPQKQAMLKDDIGWDSQQQWFKTFPNTVRLHSKGGYLGLNATQGLQLFMQYYENGLLLVAMFNGEDQHGLENSINSAYNNSWK